MTRRQQKKRLVPEIHWESQLDAIWHIVSEYLGIPPEDADSKSRRSHLVRARHIFYYLSKKHTLHTWRSIAYYTGGRDHSTAMHGVATIENDLGYDKKLRATVVNIEDRLIGRVPEHNDILFEKEKAIQFSFL